MVKAWNMEDVKKLGKLAGYKVEPGSSQRFVHGRSSKCHRMQVVAQKISTLILV